MKKTEDKIAGAFAELMIEKIKEIQVDWEKPWVNTGYTGAPRNINNRHYNGVNALMLMLYREKEGFKTPVFMTFRQAKDKGWDIKKGAKGFPVEHWSPIIKNENGKRITQEEFDNLSPEEQEKCNKKFFSKVYIVFNVEQTRLPEVSPEKWQKLQDQFSPGTLKDEEGMMRSPELDYMLKKQTWLCPVKTQLSDSAFYSPVTDSITVPLKSQFVDGEKFYGTLLHEMAHSTGHEGRLDRNMKNKFGDPQYGREELVAEMTAALVASELGITKGIEKDNVAYLQSWLKTIGETPEFLRTVMSDVNKACEMIQNRVISKEVAEELKNEAIASIDKFLEEKKAGQDEKVQVLTAEEFREKSISLGDVNVNQSPLLLDCIFIEKDKVKEKNPDCMPWIRLGNDFHIVGDDAVRLGELLRLNTHKVHTQNGELVDVISFDVSKLDTYLPQTIRKGQRVSICEVTEGIQKSISEPEMQTGPELFMTHLGNGISVWEKGDNEYTAFITPDRKVKLYKEFTPQNLQKITAMAESGNMIVGNKDTEYLALKPLNPATRFLKGVYSSDIVPVSEEKVGDKAVVCHRQNLVKAKEGELVFNDLPCIERPDAYVVSVTGLDNVRSALDYMQKLDIDMSYLHGNYFFDLLSQAEEELGSTEKEFKRIYFEVRNLGTAEKTSMAVVAFHNEAEELDKQNLLARYYIKENMMLYNQPGQKEIDEGLNIGRQILSQENYVRINGRDNLLSAMNALRHHGICFTKELEKSITEAYEQGQVMPRGVAARDKMYLHINKGLASEMDFNVSEFNIDEVPLLEVKGKTLQNASLYDRELESAYLVVGYGGNNTFDSFIKVQAGPDALQTAQKYMQNMLDLPVKPKILTAAIIEVDRDVKDSLEYRVAGKSELAQMIEANEAGGFKEICRLPVIEKVIETQLKEEENITNHIIDSTMAKKSTTEQVPEQEVKEQVNEKQEAQQTAGEEQQEEKKLRDGASVFQRKDKEGNLIPGVYGVNIVKDGVRSETATISKEDRDQYFKDVKGKTGEEAEAVRKALAEKYITPEGKRIDAPKTEAGESLKGEKGKDEYFQLHHAAPEKAERITEPRVFKKEGEQQYRIRCKIDGEQQLSRAINDAKTTAFFQGYKGMSSEDQLQRRTDLAAVVFADVLRSEKQEQSRGISR